MASVRYILAIGVVVGCHSPEPPAPPARPPARAVAAAPDRCTDAALHLALSAPDPGGPRATFTVSWEGQGTGEKSRVICLDVGGQIQLVPRGERRSVAIRAHATELQRILVDRRPHLAAVPPGADIMLGDNPCFFYELSGPRTDGWFVDAPIAYCAERGKRCRPGFARAQPPRPVVDDLCGPTEKVILRCVEEAEVRIDPPRSAGPAPEGEIDLAEPMPIGVLTRGPLRLSPSSCGFATLDTGAEKVALVVGAGERWTLALDADRRLSGRFAVGR